MRVTDKLTLIDKVGRALQAKFTYGEIDAFFAEYKIVGRKEVHTNSKWVYSKDALRGVSEETLLTIAGDLGVEVQNGLAAGVTPPHNWRDITDLRLFISHISQHKDKATRLKDCLSPFRIAGFVAHEDISPTLEWQHEIERALHTMDAFLAIHTVGFSQSIWTQQEIGFALGRGTKVISFKMGEDPTGFISKNQALARRNRTAEQIAVEVDAILGTDPRMKVRLATAKKAYLASDPYVLPF